MGKNLVTRFLLYIGEQYFLKVLKWTKEKAKEDAVDRIAYLDAHVHSNESRWRENEQAYRDEFYKKWSGTLFKISDANTNKDLELSEWLVQASLNHTFTFVRLLHSMLISNEPMVTASPARIGDEAARAAEATDTLARYVRDEYSPQTKVDLQVLHTLIYGIGVIRADWDTTKGAILEYNERTSEVTYDGDLTYRVPDPYNYCFFSSTNDINDVYGYFERFYVDLEEAESLYPKESWVVEDSIKSYDVITGKSTVAKNKVAIYEYFEKARGINGLAGRYYKCKSDGTILDMGDNPLLDAGLPVAYFADIVLPGTIQPLSIVDLLRKSNKLLNDLFSRIMENVKVAARIWMMADRSSGLDDKLTDRPYEVIQHSGTSSRPLEAITPPQLPNFIFQAHSIIVEMMQHIAGLRDFSRGNMKKNVSGFAASLMTEADNRVHIQVHERYKKSVKRLFELSINNFHQHWNDNKVISVLGEENELEAYEFKKEDFKGGYKLTVDYGTSVPIDPSAKRQMIQELLPFIQQLGIQADSTKLLEFLKLGDLISTFDAGKSARRQQKKEIKEAEAGNPIKVDYYAEDHMAHFAELFLYFQTEKYIKQSEEVKAELKQHAKDHLQAAQMMKQGIPEEEWNKAHNVAGTIPQEPQASEESIPQQEGGLPVQGD